VPIFPITPVSAVENFAITYTENAAVTSPWMPGMFSTIQLKPSIMRLRRFTKTTTGLLAAARLPNRRTSCSRKSSSGGPNSRTSVFSASSRIPMKSRRPWTMDGSVSWRPIRQIALPRSAIRPTMAKIAGRSALNWRVSSICRSTPRFISSHRCVARSNARQRSSPSGLAALPIDRNVFQRFSRIEPNSSSDSRTREK
jgi:hypothetical protein